MAATQRVLFDESRGGRGRGHPTRPLDPVMLLVVSETRDGVWVQLEGETVAEMQALERLAAQAERTSGRGMEALPRLRDLAARLGVPLRVVRR